MSLDFADMPSIIDVFGADALLMRRIKNAGFTDIAPLMLLPEYSLPANQGLGRTLDKRITELLLEVGIERRRYDYNMVHYLDRQFDRAEVAPLSSLQVAVVRDEEVNFPMYAPLQIIKHLMAKYEHPLAVIDIVSFGTDGLVDEATSSQLVGNIEEDLRHLRWRLDNLGIEFPRETVGPAAGGFQLQAVR